MDRAEFLRSINYTEGNCLEDLITRFFDQYMLLYNLVDNVRTTIVLSTTPGNISFQIEFTDENSVNNFVNLVSSNPVVLIYESTYTVNCNYSGNNTVIVMIS